MNFKNLYLNLSNRPVDATELNQLIHNDSGDSVDDYFYILLFINWGLDKQSLDIIQSKFARLTAPDKKRILSSLFSYFSFDQLGSLQLFILTADDLLIVFDIVSEKADKHSEYFTNKVSAYRKLSGLIGIQGEFDEEQKCMDCYKKYVDLAIDVLERKDTSDFERILADELLSTTTVYTAELDDAFDYIAPTPVNYSIVLTKDEMAFCLSIADDLLNESFKELIEQSLLSYSTEDSLELAKAIKPYNSVLYIEIFSMFPWYQLGIQFFINYLSDEKARTKSKLHVISKLKSKQIFKEYLEEYGEPKQNWDINQLIADFPQYNQ